MPELSIKYKPGVVPGEYIERQLRRAPDIIGGTLLIDPKQVCVEARIFAQGADNYADEEVGLIARPATILSAAKRLEMEKGGLSFLRLQERHQHVNLAARYVGMSILREWVLDPDSGLYRQSECHSRHETVVTVYPVDYSFISSRELAEAPEQ